MIYTFENVGSAPARRRRHAVPSRPLRLGLAGEHQKTNASLALSLAATWEARAPAAAARHGAAAAQRAARLLEEGVVDEEYAEGLEAAQWPGRGQASGGGGS